MLRTFIAPDGEVIINVRHVVKITKSEATGYFDVKLTDGEIEMVKIDDMRRMLPTLCEAYAVNVDVSV